MHEVPLMNMMASPRAEDNILPSIPAVTHAEAIARFNRLGYQPGVCPSPIVPSAVGVPADFDPIGEHQAALARFDRIGVFATGKGA